MIGGSNVIPIHRVVTCFILTQQQQQLRIAIFHRCDTMPTFPSFWAGVSGTIEANESPYHAAQRELQEETNLTQIVEEEQGGLYVNVPYVSKRTNQERIIRVYPFVVHVPEDVILKLRGTEHDRFQFVSIRQLESMQSECVPGLVQAFHHATYGNYDASISERVREWASDKENGASVMTQNALKLIETEENPKTVARQIAMLRPSMVPIVNVMREIIRNGKEAVTMESFQIELQRCVDPTAH
jgi:8-oxo-dGTP pyrophosphatase MutT (NUDIX family)